MLTQAEIDALLSGAIEVEQPDQGGGINLAELMGKDPPSAKHKGGKQIRPYNFWSPDRFSKEQMRAIELVHEDLAERLTSSLPSFLRTEFRPRVVHLEQGRFDDFLRDLPQGTLFHMLRMEPLPNQMVLTISPEVSWVILGRLLGGFEEGSAKLGDLTEIGEALVELTVEYMLNDLKAAWGKVVAIEPRREDSTENLHWVQMVMGNARVMLVTFELAIQSITGTMSIYIPFSMLKPITNVLNPHVWIAGREEKRTDPLARRAILENLTRVSVPVRVLLGSVNLTVVEVADLQPGDVIRLDCDVNHRLPILVGDRARFTGQVGRVGNRVAVTVDSVIKSPVEM